MEKQAHAGQEITRKPGKEAGRDAAILLNADISRPEAAFFEAPLYIPYINEVAALPESVDALW